MNVAGWRVPSSFTELLLQLQASVTSAYCAVADEMASALVRTWQRGVRQPSLCTL